MYKETGVPTRAIPGRPPKLSQYIFERKLSSTLPSDLRNPQVFLSCENTTRCYGSERMCSVKEAGTEKRTWKGEHLQIKQRSCCPQQMLQLLKGSAMDVIWNGLFIGDIDILKYKCTNRYIRKVISNERIYKQPRWSFVFFGNINWNKTRTICDKYCMNNKIKEVTFKIVHNVYPVKSVLERFRIINEYSCTFCGLKKETIIHLFYQCTYT